MPWYKLVLRGNLTENQEDTIAAFVRRLGLVVESVQQLPRPPWTIEEMELLDLALSVLPPAHPAYPVINFFDDTTDHKSREREEAYIRQLGGQSVADLTSRTWSQFVEAHQRLAAPKKGADWRLGSLILAFMLEQGLHFSDVNPATILRTPLLNADLDTRTQNLLAGQGINWLELLQFVTKAELLHIRMFADKSLDKVIAQLTRLGLSLKTSN